MNPTGKKIEVQAVSDFCIKCQTNQYHMNDCDCKCHFEPTKIEKVDDLIFWNDELHTGQQVDLLKDKIKEFYAYRKEDKNRKSLGDA